jgi:protoporphyrinogen oxidase
MITKRLGERLSETGCKILLNTRVEEIFREGDLVTGVSLSTGGKTETLVCDGVINTTPINECTLSIRPSLGQEIDQAASLLRFRSIVFVGVRVRRPRVLPASFMYFREHSFNRITDLAHFSFKIEPPGSTLLVAEVACDPEDVLWTDEARVKEAVIADLEKESLLTRDEVAETIVFRSRYAHPIYTLGYEDALGKILDGLGRLGNFETAGRQGRFQYINTHVAMKMGYEAADRLVG